MTEYQIFNMMYVGFISNSMYFVGMVLLTWLGLEWPIISIIAQTQICLQKYLLRYIVCSLE